MLYDNSSHEFQKDVCDAFAAKGGVSQACADLYRPDVKDAKE